MTRYEAIKQINERNQKARLAEGLINITDNVDNTFFVSNVEDFRNAVQVGQSALGGYACPTKSLDPTFILDLIDKQSVLGECHRSQYAANKEYLVTLESAKYDYASELDKAALKDSPTMISIPAVEARINTCLYISDEAKRSLTYSPKEWCLSNVSRTFADAVSSGILHNTTWGLDSLTAVEYNSDSAEATDKLRYVKTGVADSLSENPFAELAKMIGCIQGPMLDGCKFFLNHRTFLKLLATYGSEKYIVYDRGYRLFGFPVVIFSHVDSEDADKYVCYFGDFKTSILYSVQNDGIYTVEDVASVFPDSYLYMSMIFQVALDGRKIVALKCAE